METTARNWTLGEIAELLGGTLEGPSDYRIRRPVSAGSSDSEGITFAESAEYFAKVENSSVGAVLLPLGSPSFGVSAIHVERPRQSFGRLLSLFHRPLPMEEGVHPTAIVSPDAKISPSAEIGPYAVVERFAEIGANTRIYPFAYIGESCRLGDNVTIFPHAVLYQEVHVGDRSIVHAGAILGADGFGFTWDGPRRSRRLKIPQVGRVEVGTDVEIGALTAVDRATAGDTVVANGVKLDNLVQVGHNCVVGEHTVIAAQTAVGGSSEVGKRNEIGGQVAINDHVVIGDDIVLAGRTGVTKDLPNPGVYWGVPAIPIVTAKRVSALTVKLPEMYKRLKDLEAKIAELERDLD